MIDFLTDTSSLFSSAEFKPIYDHFRDEYDIRTPKLFVIAASVGFYHQKKADFTERGSEFKNNYINDPKDRTSVYTIILNDPELGKDIESFGDSDFQRRARRTLEQYAQAGMQILVDEVFRTNWEGHQLNKSYKDYNYDLMLYVMKLSESLPF